jgi:hypothetical protein
MRTAQVIEINGSLAKFLRIGGKIHVLSDAESSQNFIDIFYRSISGKTVKGVLNLKNAVLMDVQRLCRNYIVNFAEAGPVTLYIKGEEAKLLSVHYNTGKKEIAMGHLDDEQTDVDARECCEFVGYKLRAPTSLISTLKKIVRNSLPNLEQNDVDFEHVKDALYEKDYDLFEKKGNFYFPISIEMARVKGLLELDECNNVFYYEDFEGDVILDKKWIALVYGTTGCTCEIEGKEFKFTKEELDKIARDEDDDEES